jgi:two-component system sensor histidine kinase KdpD
VAIALHRDAVQAEAVETAALRRSDEVKTALLRAVSHDLRSPVTAVVTAGHALGAGSLTDAERSELSAAVVEEGQRLSALIDKLLDLSRLEAGRAEPREDWISVEEVLLAARDALHADATSVRFTIEGELPAIRADAAQLEQVFVNLLENARRYSRGRLVSVQGRRAGDRVVIGVVDQGPGIARADQERIFEPFYRGRQPAAGRWTGSGLGLAIAKGFVEANGGRIWVDSLPGQGTSFFVELPVPDAEPVPAAG